ncbi:hypothetical protein FQN49_008304, partial [Arthroderma sp. PD_2]
MIEPISSLDLASLLGGNGSHKREITVPRASGRAIDVFSFEKDVSTVDTVMERLEVPIFDSPAWNVV